MNPALDYINADIEYPQYKRLTEEEQMRSSIRAYVDGKRKKFVSGKHLARGKSSSLRSSI